MSSERSPSSKGRGGRRPGSGRKPEPGFCIRPPVRVLTQAEADEIMALTPRERALRLTTRGADGAEAAAKSTP